MKNLIILFLPILIITSCENIESSNQSTESKPIVIGYESGKNGKYKIVNGDINSVEIVKAYFDAYNNLINGLLNLGKYDDALVYISNAIEIAPENYELYHKRGNIFLKKKQPTF